MEHSQPDKFPTLNELRQTDALSPRSFSSASGYPGKPGLKLNGTYQLLVNADDVNLLKDITDTIKRNKGTAIAATKKVDSLHADVSSAECRAKQ